MCSLDHLVSYERCLLTAEIRNDLGSSFVGSKRENDSLEAMDSIDFQVNLLSLHLLL